LQNNKTTISGRKTATLLLFFLQIVYEIEKFFAKNRHKALYIAIIRHYYKKIKNAQHIVILY